MIAAEVAQAFNAVNERKSWTARPLAQDGRETVHFTAPANIVTLVLECEHRRFQVRFNKAHASWGDYCRSIARSLHVVTSTLKRAGLPFDAAEEQNGTDVLITVATTGAIYVATPETAPPTVEAAIMPELFGFAAIGGLNELLAQDDAEATADTS